MMHNSKSNKIILLSFFTSAFSIFYLIPNFVLAYVPLVTDGPLASLGTNPDLKVFLVTIFNWGIGVAVALSVLFIIFGGVEYMTTDAVFKKEDGKKRIQAAVVGLLIALSSWLILNQINPKIFVNDLSLNGDLIKGAGQLNTGVSNVATNVSSPGTSDGIPTYIQGTPDGTVSGDNFALTKTDSGYSITPSRVSIDTDGKTPPPFYDKDYRSQTSLSGLDANTDNYVVVPLGSSIPLGTKVIVTDHTTGRTITAKVGDRGPYINGYGELSLAAARNLGAWTEGMGNSVSNHTISYDFITNN